MATTIIRPKDKNEWLEHRKSGIGSSEVASILGLNPWETPYQLWRSKKGLEEPKTETFAMKAGHYLEDAVARFWTDETSREIIKASAEDILIVNNEKPFLRVSPDRTFWLPGMPKNANNKGILECKTTQAAIDPEDLPKHWFCQLQYQLGVAGLEQGSLAWLTGGREFGHKDIALVPDFYEWMTEEVERFWVDNILGDVEPEAINASDVVAKYARHSEGKYLAIDEQTYQAYLELKEVREKIAALEATKEQLEDAIKLQFADAEAITYCGETIATWKAAKDSQKFDSKKFQKDHPGMASAYLFTVPGSRRFLLK